jgi:sortase B
MAAGFVPLLVLSLMNWLIPASVGYSKYAIMLKSAEELTELFAFACITEGQLSVLKMTLIAGAGLLVLSVLFLLAAMAGCKSKTRIPLAFTGFALGATSPLLFIIVMGFINRLASQRAIEPSFYAYLALLSGAVALIYCVRYPTLGSIRDKRNSFGTKLLTAFVPVRGDGIKEGVRKVVFTGALISFIYFGATLGTDMFNVWRSRVNQLRHQNMLEHRLDVDDEIRQHQVFVRSEVKPLEEYLPLFRENNDMVGYIKIGDSRVNYPVLQTNNNHYYLDFSFYGRRDRGGAIFADFRNIFDGLNLSDNTVLYGHNMSSGDFFAGVSQYYRTAYRSNGTLSFYKENPVIRFDTMFEHIEWKVFAAVLFNTQRQFGEVIEYWRKHDFDDAEDFHNYIFMIMDRSVLFTDVDLQYGDQLLTLSTCYWPMGESRDTRSVVFARRVRPGESSSVNVDAAARNTGVLRFEEEVRHFGRQTWNGRVWDYRRYLLSYNG